MDTMDNNELISALADGQLRGEAFATTVQAVCTDTSARAAWHAYHLIGDVLRSGEAGHAGGTQPFLDKLSARLAQEPCPQPELAPVGVVRPEWTSGRAANDGAMRWKMLAGVASMAAVAAVGWSVVGVGSRPAAQPQLAAVQQPPAQGEVLARAQAGGVMIRDARLDELLAAHRQLGGASALQMPAGFVRNVTFESPAR